MEKELNGPRWILGETEMRLAKKLWVSPLPSDCNFSAAYNFNLQATFCLDVYVCV